MLPGMFIGPGMAGGAGGTPAAYRAVDTLGTGSSTVKAIAVPVPTYVSGDLLICIVAAHNTCVWTAPSGWTAIREGTGNPNFSYYWKIATGSEPSTYTWTLDTGRRVKSAMLSFSDAAYDTSGVAIAATSTIDAPSITAGVSGFLIATAVTKQSTSITGPSGFTEIVNISGGTNASVLQVGYKAITPGATGTSTFTLGTARAAEAAHISVG